MAIRCLTFNTFCWALGPGPLYQAPERRRRAKDAGRWLRSLDADVVFLQELYRKEDADTVFGESGFPHAYFPGHGSGLGILSRYPLERKTFRPFLWQGSQYREVIRLTARMRRGTAAAWARLDGGEPVLLACTHLLARYAGVSGFELAADALTPERKANLLELAAAMEEWTRGDGPWLLAGDFNMNQSSEELAFFRRIEGVGDCLKEAEPKWESLETYSADNPWVKAQGNPGEGVLDYIFYSKAHLSVKEARILAETDSFSDHRALRAELTEGRGRPSEWKLPLVAGEREAIDRYFGALRYRFPVWLAPLAGWTQRRDIRRFLQLQ